MALAQRESSFKISRSSDSARGQTRAKDGLMRLTVPFDLHSLLDRAADPQALGAPHPRLARHPLEARGNVWSVAKSARELARQRDEVLEYFEIGVRLEGGARVIDVGAHCGLFAIEAAARAPGVELALVEPIPVFQEAIVRNLREAHLVRNSSARTRVHRVGVSATSTDAVVEFTSFARLPTDTTCRVEDKYAEFERVFRHHAGTARAHLEGALPGALGRTLGAFAHKTIVDIPVAGWKRQLFDQAIGVEHVRARLAPLTTIVAQHPGPIDLLKIDCEGSELAALEGLDAGDWPRVGAVVLEGNDEVSGRAIAELLRARGLTRQTVTTPRGAAEQGLVSYLLYADRT